MGYTRKVKLGMVKGEERSLPEMGEVRELVKGLGQAEQEVVLAETVEFYRARQAGQLSYLSMGEHLSKVRDVLEPHSLWKKYAGGLPNMGIATAYRMIWAWENAQKALPAGTLRVVARDGYRIISNEKGKEFAPGYDRAVKAVEKEIGPAPDDERAAPSWLRSVVEKKRELGRLKAPVEAKRFSMAGIVQRVVKFVDRVINRLPETKKDVFLQKLIQELMSLGSVKRSGAVAA